VTNRDNTVEYKDDLIFAACEFRWSRGDKFALIEAVAICAANNLPYPAWVRDQINNAMTGVFRSVFPDTSLIDGRAGLGISHLPEGRDLEDKKASFQKSTKAANKLLSFTLDRQSIVAKHINAVRDFHLADLVERFADFKTDPNPGFDRLGLVITDLAENLNLSNAEWNDRVKTGKPFGPINGRIVDFHSIEPVCRLATFDIIDNAWDQYKAFFMEQRIDLFEENGRAEITG
jgi:hypothetical protein